MKTYLFGDIKYFCIDSSIIFTIHPSINIQNLPRDGIGGLIEDNFKKYLGLSGMANFETRWPIAYTEITRQQSSTNLSIDERIELDMHGFKISLHAFDSFLWFVKDNSVYNQFIYCKVPIDNDTYYSNALCLETHTNSIGKHEDVRFSERELKYAHLIKDKFATIHIKLLSDTSNQPTESEVLDDFRRNNGRQPDEYNTYSRIRLAFEHIKIARSLYYLPAKIGSYMSFFETLFSTDSENVNYKVAERVAFYITKRKDKRLDVFDKIRSAYDIRSKYYHGAKIKKNQVKLESMQLESKYIDELARKVFRKVITRDSDIFMQGQDEHASYLKMLLFS